MLEARVSRAAWAQVWGSLRHSPAPLKAHMIQPLVSLSMSFASMVLSPKWLVGVG